MEDSRDISPTLFKNNTPIREDLIHHSGDGTFAIRKGDWKLIEGVNAGGFSKGLKIEGIPVETKGQLYNINNDPSEGNNLYAKNKKKVQELSQLLNKYKNADRSSYE